MQRKAIVLLSGGLDSVIAAQLIKDQGIDLVGMNFHSPFCTCASESAGNPCNAAFFAQKLGIELKFLNKGDEYLEIVKNPQFGYGKNLNPCIDCRIYIFKHAWKYAQEIGAEFLITGEVLGQRPKSQHKKALLLIEKEAGLEGKILRPLSAKWLPPTEMEKQGIIDRDALLSIKGRSRNIQLELAREFELIDQYCASGGCRLTNKEYAAKLKDYLAYSDNPRMAEVIWLKIGRHFRYKGIKFICGRDEQENKQIHALKHEKDTIIELKSKKGPTVIMFSKPEEEFLLFGIALIKRYSKCENDAEFTIETHQKAIPAPIKQNIPVFDLDSFRI